MYFSSTTALAAIATVASLASFTTAIPNQPVRFTKRDPVSAKDAILAIAPASSSCTDAPFPEECITAADAAPHLIKAMVDQGLYNHAQIGAVLALMAFECGDFKYNRNHFPGRPGQGTRNMQFPKFNADFARSKEELKAQVPEGDGNDLPDDQKAAVLDLVMNASYEFETGPWFLVTQCEKSVLDTLASSPDAGWAAYMACVGVTSDADREAYWTRAKTVFGIV